MRLDPFIVALFVCVVLASLLPVSGAPAEWLDGVTTAAIVLLFFLHGVRLKRDALIAGLGHWRLHLLILAITYAAFPLLGLGLRLVGGPLMTPSLWLGVLFICVLPSTVQSSIAFTSIAGGNVAASLCAAAFSNLLGVLLTPLLVGLVMQMDGGHGMSGAHVARIALLLLAPFVVGHLLRPWLGDWADRRKTLLSFTDRGTILLAVYGSFSAAVVSGLWQQVDAVQLAVLVGVCCLLLALVLGLTFAVARLAGFDRADQIAIVFAGSKKSLASGVPMARVLFPGAAAGPMLLPIMIFHQIQLVVCAWLARRYAAHRPEA
jgi:sodium/bile acid cotransporter 7